MLSSQLDIEPDPFAAGGYGDVYKGTLGGAKACIKRVRVYTRDDPKTTMKACCQRFRFPSLPSLMKFTGLLRRGGNVETLETSERPTAPRCHSRPLPARFTLDAWWRPAGTHQETP